MKKVTLFIISSLFTSVLLLPSNSQGQEWTDDQLELWNYVEETWNTWKTGDLDGSLKVFHDKYLGWSNEALMPADKARITKMWTMMMPVTTIDWIDLQPVRITIADDAAVVHYYFNFSGMYAMGEKKEKFEQSGKNSEFYIKEKGKWMLLGDHTSLDEDDD